VLIGICSSGLHSNGFSLVRHLLREHAIDVHSKFLSEGGAFCMHAGPKATVGEVLLTPTTIYSPVLHDLGHAGGVHAAAHITGGGFPDNVGRALPDDLAAEIDLGAWSVGPVFSWLHSLGVRPAEMLNTFNCGLGMVVATDPAHVEKNLAIVQKNDLEAWVIGEVTARGDGAAVRYRGELRL
jgi:phosphoribosylaminoimidazole synthetase